MDKNFSQTPHNAISPDIEFVMTMDGSCGLYNSSVGDIYHSSYGALSEAKEKFIRPLNFHKNFLQKKEIKVLDVCSGIGYNTKAFLNYLFNSKIAPETKIHIDAIEIDKKLTLLSPFIKDGLRDCACSYFLFANLQEDIFPEIEQVNSVVSDSKNRPFLSRAVVDLFQKYRFDRYKYNHWSRYLSFLHNIYYQYVSKRNKKALKALKMNNFTFRPHYMDARLFLKSAKNGYDIVFLDAFTPLKLPTLWSEEFFARLYELMNPDSMLVTYSNSAAVRNAMLKAGFFVGKTFDTKKRPSGTVASKNKNFIEHPLDEFDFGLIQTNAGVAFNDPALDWPPEKILEEYNAKKSRLNLPSSSSYIKSHKRKEETLCTT